MFNRLHKSSCTIGDQTFMRNGQKWKCVHKWHCVYVIVFFHITFSGFLALCETKNVNVFLIVCSMLIPFAMWLNIGCQESAYGMRVNPVLPTEESPLPSFAMKFKKNTRRLLPSVAPTSLSASSLHCSHPSCVPERSAGLISARLCVSCRVSPKALLAPLAQAALRFQTAWADWCLPNQSVLLSLISIFQTSIYFPLASQDQNSAELIINRLAVFRFHFLPPPLLPLKVVMVSKFLSLVEYECRVVIQRQLSPSGML